MGVVLSHRPPSIAHAEAARAGRRSGGRFGDRRSVGGWAVSRCAARRPTDQLRGDRNSAGSAPIVCPRVLRAECALRTLPAHRPRVAHPARRPRSVHPAHRPGAHCAPAHRPAHCAPRPPAGALRTPTSPTGRAHTGRAPPRPCTNRPHTPQTDHAPLQPTTRHTGWAMEGGR